MRTGLLQRASLALALTLGLSGCVSHTVKTVDARPPESVGADIDEARLLDVGVHLFDPAIPDDWEEREQQLIFPEVRRAEARYMPYVLKNTLEASLSWGAVRVLPRASNAVDVDVDATILQSDGETLHLEVQVVDATGRVWFDNQYQLMASKYAYEQTGPGADPFQGLYTRIANDMLAYRQRLTDSEVRRIREVAEMRFAADFAPEVFGGYVRENRRGRHELVRLPAEGDPMLERTRRIREREYLFIDTLDEYYGGFNADIGQAYNDYRRFTYDEAVMIRELTARKNAAFGAAVLAGAAAVVGAMNSDSTAGQAVAIGGAIAAANLVISAQNTKNNIAIAADSLKQVSESLEKEITPSVIEVDERTVRLSGTVDEQYEEWRGILREIYREELGLPVIDEGPTTPSTQAMEAGVESS